MIASHIHAYAQLWGEPPLDPTAEEARRLLEAELSNPTYQPASEPWYMRILARILEFLGELSGTAMPSGNVLWLLLGFIVFVVLVILFAGPLRRTRKAASQSSVLGDATITAEEYRARARKAASNGDFSLASVETFRAVVKRAEETVLITEQFGRTAREAALAIGSEVPELQSEATWGGALFDAVEYGGASADASDVARLDDLYGALEKPRTMRSLSNDAADSTVVAP